MFLKTKGEGRYISHPTDFLLATEFHLKKIEGNFTASDWPRMVSVRYCYSNLRQ